MSDLISRQAVIDRINKLIEVEKKQGTDDWGYGRERVNAYEAMLHFVKSEYLYPSVEPEKCSDCISRQAARNALLNKGQHSKRYKLGETWELNLMEIEETLWALPSIEPEKCGDCINREALNKKLNYLCECLCEYSKKQREFMCEACKLGAVIDAVEEMPSVEPERKPGKWIPVSERLPEIKRDVLVYLKNGRFFVAALFAEPFPDAAGQCYRWIGEEEISFRFCDVEAWMELPKRKNDYMDIYLCDPDKNKDCRKTICQKDCYFTTREECAKRYSDGEAVKTGEVFGKDEE